MFTIVEENRINLDQLIEYLSKNKKIEKFNEEFTKRKRMINYLKKIRVCKKDSLLTSKKN
jgi:hypothetical protein